MYCDRNVDCVTPLRLGHESERVYGCLLGYKQAGLVRKKEGIGGSRFGGGSGFGDGSGAPGVHPHHSSSTSSPLTPLTQ